MDFLEEFLTVSSVQISIPAFISSLLLTAFLASILANIYTKYGSTLSNRRVFSRNFVLIALTTMLVITIVKSSLALSLGLVGALSIVRFRSAIKEPEELAYLFLAIGIGLGMGAHQILVTVLAFAIIIAIIVVTHKLFHSKYDDKNINLTIHSSSKNITLDKIIEILSEHSSGVNLRRFDETPEALEVALMVTFNDLSQLTSGKEALEKIDDKLKFSFIENKAIY
jgi:uncharacterized membrane protein YhiD involved in acid resistance